MDENSPKLTVQKTYEYLKHRKAGHRLVCSTGQKESRNPKGAENVPILARLCSSPDTTKRNLETVAHTTKDPVFHIERSRRGVQFGDPSSVHDADPVVAGDGLKPVCRRNRKVDRQKDRGFALDWELTSDAQNGTVFELASDGILDLLVCLVIDGSYTMRGGSAFPRYQSDNGTCRTDGLVQNQHPRVLRQSPSK